MDHASEIRVAAAEHRADPGKQLGKVKRFDQVVVGPELEPLDPIAGLVARAENDDPSCAVARQGAAELPPVDARHHQVEHDQVRLELVDDAEGDMTVWSGADIEPLMAQAERDEVGDALLVVDDEEAGLPTHCLEYMSRLATTPPRDDREYGFSAASQQPLTLDR